MNIRSFINSEFFQKYKHMIAYLFFGGMTTVINIAAYYLCSRYVFTDGSELSQAICNVIAWVLAVTFAYLSNRRYVFDSQSRTRQQVLREAGSFFASRVATLLVDIALMALMTSVLRWNDMLAKIISNVVVVVLNYVLSKLVVFRKK